MPPRLVLYELDLDLASTSFLVRLLGDARSIFFVIFVFLVAAVFVLEGVVAAATGGMTRVGIHVGRARALVAESGGSGGCRWCGGGGGRVGVITDAHGRRGRRWGRGAIGGQDRMIGCS
jgi:hypothetical protein